LLRPRKACRRIEQTRIQNNRYDGSRQASPLQSLTSQPTSTTSPRFTACGAGRRRRFKGLRGAPLDAAVNQLLAEFEEEKK
jgi:hypothetical protein